MNEQNNFSYGASHEAFRKSVASKIYIASMIFLGLFIVANLVDAFVNIAFFGMIEYDSVVYLQATRVAAMVYSPTGYTVVALVKLLIPIACLFTLFYSIKLRTTKCADPVNHIFKTRHASSILFIFALFTVVQCAMFIFAFSFNMFKADNYNFVATACSFFGITELYEYFGLAEFFAGLTGTFAKIAVTVAVDLVVAAYALAQLLLYKWTKDFLIALCDIVSSGIAQMQERPPFKLGIAVSLANIVLAVFMVLNGSFVAAILNVALAAYLLTNGLYLRRVKNNISVAGNVSN